MQIFLAVSIQWEADDALSSGNYHQQCEGEMEAGTEVLLMSKYYHDHYRLLKFKISIDMHF